MKKKFRVIAVLLMMIVLTGCTPEYNIEIKDGKVYEELSVTGFTSQQKAAFFLPQYAKVDSNSDYHLSSTDNKLSYSYTFSFKDYLKSNMAKSCYDALLLYKDKETNNYVLHTGSEFRCYPFQVNDNVSLDYDSININIKFTNYKVIENNADSINKNVYTWNINKNNYKNKTILVKFKSTKSNKQKASKNKMDELTIAIIILGSVIMLMLGLTFYISSTNKRKNRL